jgi:hypothetical protein
MRKIFRNKIVFLFLLFSLFFQTVWAADYDSSNFTVKDPVITSGTQTASSSTYILRQSLSQIAPGSSTSSNFQLLSGFQYYMQASPNVLSATAGDAQVSLNWTVPQVFLGAVISSYEVGVGTASGVYTYQTVGNVTSYTQTGLSNGTVYYFKIKARTAGGLYLVSSNEASATPQAATTPQAGGGGGGGGGSGVVLSGQAAPSSEVVVLQNGQKVATGFTDNSGKFSIVVNNAGSGQINFVLYYTDPEGTRSDFVQVKVQSTAGISSASNILLPPTLRADMLEVKAGEIITFSGYTLPGSTVIFEISGGQVGQALAKSNGFYHFPFDTKGQDLGQKVAKTKAVLGSLSTPFSSAVRFLIGTQNIPSEAVGKCPAKGDFNSDCRVDLVDFSILAFWFRKTNFPTQIDLNQDGIIDLVDFSILAFYWTD